MNDRPGANRPVMLIDNYDSFTYNIVQALHGLDRPLRVVRNDAVTVADIHTTDPAAVILSPGPGAPPDSGICPALIRELDPEIPIFGVCLGLQCLLAEDGSIINTLDEIVHGKTSFVRHQGDPLFRGFPSPFAAARYHSLGTRSVPPGWRELARTDSGIVMAARHESLPRAGVQFHPESFLTPNGAAIFGNFLRYYAHLA
ncbi:MAG: aminodeoxychorismate/anthranilate synthase component II [Acidobacteria bacterium]|nr:aminodeoxychorismate/anthranilate synthase component II [Acidobacteriota bacterium]